MSLLFFDGFGTGDINTKYQVVAGGWATGQGGRFANSYSANSASVSITLARWFTASAQIYSGLAWFSSGTPYISFWGDSAVTQHVTVVRNASGFLELRRGSTAGTILATGTTQVLANVWWYIEVGVTIADAGGTVQVRINGSLTPEINYTGDTKNGGTNTTIDAISFGHSTGLGGVNFADFYIANSSGTINNNFLGDICVRTLIPNGDGAFSQLMGSDGNQVSNYLLVDEVPANGADYVASQNIGDKDSYLMSNLPSGSTTVYGVQVAGFMQKSDASLAQAKLFLRQGGTNYYGATRVLGASYLGYYDLFETDPSTSIAWTPTGVNSLEAGMEVA